MVIRQLRLRTTADEADTCKVLGHFFGRALLDVFASPEPGLQ